MAPRELVQLRLRFPYGVQPQALEAVFTGLAALPGPSWQRLMSPAFVGIEVISTGAGIEHLVTVPRRWRDVVVGQFRSQLAVRVEDVAAGDQIDAQRAHRGDQRNRHDDYGVAVELRLVHPRGLLRVDNAEAVAAALLGSLPVSEGQQLRLQWLLTPAAPLGDERAPGGLRQALLGGNRPTRPDTRERRKGEDVLFLAVVRLSAEAGSLAAAQALLRRPLAVLLGVRHGSTRLLSRLVPRQTVARRMRLHTLPVVWPIVVSARELVAISGVPVGSPTVAGLRLGASRQLPPPSELPREGCRLMRSNYPGQERVVAMHPRAALAHVSVWGPTGSGKSVLLTHMAQSLMRLGYGLVLLDPKGDTARTVLGVVPDDRRDQVIYLDPTDDPVVGFNLLADERLDRLELTVDQVVAWFAKRYHASWGPRSEDLARHALRTLAESNLTLAELPGLLGDEAFRRRVVGHLQDRLLRGWWTWFDALSPGERAHITAPLLNKVRAVIGRERLRAVVGVRTPGWTMEGVLADGRILVANLAKGQLGDDASALLGSLLVARLWSATLGRAALPEHRRRPFYAVVDEFHDFVGPEAEFGDFLAQARGLGVGLVLAAQHQGQLSSSLRQDVRSNARTKLTFAAPADDAATLARDFSPYLTAADLQGLGSYEMAGRIFSGSTMAPAVTGTTLPPVAPDPARIDAVRRRSRERYGHSRSDVEAELRARQEPPVPEGPLGRRRREP